MFMKQLQMYYSWKINTSFPKSLKTTVLCSFYVFCTINASDTIFFFIHTANEEISTVTQLPAIHCWNNIGKNFQNLS